jgi:hypothetical protein
MAQEFCPLARRKRRAYPGSGSVRSEQRSQRAKGQARIAEVVFARSLSSPISITNKVILGDQDVSGVISGGGKTRLFNVGPGGSLFITNVILADGAVLLGNGATNNNADGGAIYNNGGIVSLTSCTLSNNSAQALLNAGVARGGAVFNLGGQVYIANSLAIGNFIISGAAPGSSVFSSSESNALSFGGVFYNQGGTMTLAGDSILNNGLSADVSLGTLGPAGGIGLGGAFFNTNGSLVLLGCIVSNNVCSASAGLTQPQCYGGAIFQASGSLSLTNSSLISNHATGGAGGGRILSSAACLRRSDRGIGRQCFIGSRQTGRQSNQRRGGLGPGCRARSRVGWRHLQSG